MANKLIAFRINNEIEKILEAGMKAKKLNKTDFIIQAIVNNAGYDYIPAKIIKRKVSR